MVSFYERTFLFAELAVNDRDPLDRLHSAVEAHMKSPHQDEPRTYIWGRDIDSIVVRSRYKLPGFHVCELPNNDDIIQFRFQAAPRIGGRKTKAGRKPCFSTMPPQEWASTKLPSIGLDPLNVSAVPFISPIAAMHEKNSRVRGDYVAATIHGEARITDAKVFGETMRDGVSGAGPRCYNFGFVLWVS